MSRNEPRRPHSNNVMVPVPDLQSPTALLSHPAPTASDRSQPAIAASNFSSTKRASVAVGNAYKLSSETHSLRRLKGVLPVLVHGQAVNLVNPLTQTPVQSFALTSTDVPVSAPLTLLKSVGAGRSLRLTYLALRSPASDTSTEIRAYVEELSPKGKENAQINVKKQVVTVSGIVQLLQPLSDGALVLTHADDSLTILSHSNLAFDDESSMLTGESSLEVTDSIPAPESYATRSHFHVSLLDPSSAKKLVSGSSQIEQAAVAGLRVSITSATKLISDTNQTGSRKKKTKASKGRKSGTDADDPVADQAEQEHLPTGSLELEVVLFSRSFEGVDKSISAQRLGKDTVPGIADAHQVDDVHLHSDGRLVVLLRTGNIVITTLQLSNDGPTMKQSKKLLVPSLTSDSIAYSSSLLCLSADHILVLGITQSAAEQRVASLLIDIELEVALCQIDWPVPFSSGSDVSQSMVSISRIAGSMVTIVIGPSPVHGAVSTVQRRTSVLTMPFVVPDTSVLQHALGKGELTAQWLSQKDILPASDKTLDESREALLAQLTTLQGTAGSASASKMSAAVTKWANQQFSQGKTLEAVSSKQGADFYTTLLDVVLPEGAKPFPREALKHLLAHDSVHSSVFTCPDGGRRFWSRLRSKNDVDLLHTAVRRIKDVSEDELASLLATVNRLTLRPEEGPSKAPQMVAFLREVISVPVSRPALRSALKNHLRNVDDVVVLLQICNVWLNAAAKKPLDNTKQEAEPTPDASLVMTFASDVMDTFFPLLVSTPSSYDVLRSLSKTIARYMNAFHGLRTLNAPLSAFAKLDVEQQMDRKRAQKNAPLAASGTLVSAGNIKVSANKSGSNLRAEMGGGLGLKLGTHAEAKSKRLESFEQSMLVGAYTLERLEI